MMWLLGGLLAAVLFLAPLIGLFSQPWAPWWFRGATASPVGVVPAPDMQAPAGPLMADSSDLLRVIQPWMGTPYVFGGNTLRGVDCSGFTFQVLATLGYRFPWRTAQTQYDHVALVTVPEPGDLVFFRATYASPDFITHVGFYVAPGVMISAAEPAVGRQSLSSPFWTAHFAGYGRVAR